MQSRQFSEKRKGYDVQEIDEFIDEVMFSLGEYSSRLEAASARVVELEIKLAGLEQQAGASEDVAAELASARQMAEDARAEVARHAAELAQASQSSASLSGQVEAARTQLEAARESHIRQQAQIVALQEEVTHLRGLLEQERSAPRPPEEVAHAVEVLAAAQRTADDLRRDAQAEADALRESAASERDRALAEFREETEAIRARIDGLAAVEEDFRSRLSVLLDGARDSLLGATIVSTPSDARDTSWIPEPHPASAQDDEIAFDSTGSAAAAPADSGSWGQVDAAQPVGELFNNLESGFDDNQSAASWGGAETESSVNSQASPAAWGGADSTDGASVPSFDATQTFSEPTPAWGGGYDLPTEAGGQEDPPTDPYSSDYDQPRAWGVSS